MVSGFVTLIIFLFALGGMILMYMSWVTLLPHAGQGSKWKSLALGCHLINLQHSLNGREQSSPSTRCCLAVSFGQKVKTTPTVPGGLASANPWKRLVVLFAGPMMNLITAVVVFSFLIALRACPCQDR